MKWHFSVLFSLVFAQSILATPESEYELMARKYEDLHARLATQPSLLGVIWGSEYEKSQPLMTFNLVSTYSPYLRFPIDRSQGWTFSSLTTGLNLSYRGEYDFRTDLDSGPVVSKVQNPSVGWFTEIYVGLKPMLYFDVSWNHESNGQPYTKKEDLQTLIDLDPDYNSQFFASMGWNFYNYRGLMVFEVDDFVNAISEGIARAVPSKIVAPKSLGLDLGDLRFVVEGQFRAYFPQEDYFGPISSKPLEDRRNFTNLEIQGNGIRDYYLGKVGFHFLDIPVRFTLLNFPDVKLSVDMSIDVRYYVGLGIGRSHELVVYPTFNNKRNTKIQFWFVKFDDIDTSSLPLYFAFRYGYNLSPANYFKEDWTASAGFAWTLVRY